MHIAAITLRNFRCFGEQPTTVDLSDLTALVGSNGCGKTAVLQALCRLFGISTADRHLRREDFHVPAGKRADDLTEIRLLIEARLEFPELIAAGAAGVAGTAVSECFRQMLVTVPGGSPFCRVRLEGKWTRGSLQDGDVDEELFWVMTDAADIKPEQKHRMQAHDRSRIHVLYVPAARDPIRQIKQVSGSLVARMLNAVEWSEAVRGSVAEASGNVREAFEKERGVGVIQTAITQNWRTFHNLPTYSQVNIQPVSNRLEDIIRRVDVLLGPGGDGTEHPVDRLSDGLRSLFYFTLVGATFDVERAAAGTATTAAGSGAAGASPGISAERLELPTLTVFAVEEPENHLAPQYLGRTMGLLRRLVASNAAQAVVTSHSASILGRVEPEEVRYFRLDPTTSTAMVRRIVLPNDRGEAYKYVREAVRAYPELYFAKLVILGEGDSEEIVLPRLAQSLGVSIDKSFVAIVPLGGRHVNHLWRLLYELSIPVITLLDLDRERGGGGWGRIRYACVELLKVGRTPEEVFTVADGKGGTRTLTSDEVAQMHTWPLDIASMATWMSNLEKFGVFFSNPLDLDFAMLEAFPAAYHGTAPEGGGPRIPPAPSPAYEERLADARKRVLKEMGTDGNSYTDEQRAAFIWYSYLFLGKGKPTTHMLALDGMTPTDLAKGAPDAVKRLVTAMKANLNMVEESADAVESTAI